MTIAQLAWVAEDNLKAGKLTQKAYDALMDTEVVPKKIIDEVQKKVNAIQWEREEGAGFESRPTKDKFKLGRCSAADEIQALISHLLHELYKDE